MKHRPEPAARAYARPYTAPARRSSRRASVALWLLASALWSAAFLVGIWRAGLWR